ncbi:MAG: hypothetical protein EZS28_051774, partial [Streblomastix strix]
EFAKAENVFPVKELAEAIGGQTLTEQDAQQLLINFFWYPGQYNEQEIIRRIESMRYDDITLLLILLNLRPKQYPKKIDRAHAIVDFLKNPLIDPSKLATHRKPIVGKAKVSKNSNKDDMYRPYKQKKSIEMKKNEFEDIYVTEKDDYLVNEGNEDNSEYYGENQAEYGSTHNESPKQKSTWHQKGLKHGSREKKPVDPERPKRPPNSFVLFQKDVRDKVNQQLKDEQEANKDSDKPVVHSNFIVIQRMAQVWKALKPEEQKEYQTR